MGKEISWEEERMNLSQSAETGTQTSVMREGEKNSKCETEKQWNNCWRGETGWGRRNHGDDNKVKKFIKTTFIKNFFSSKTTFIKKPLSSKNHFHQKPLSSKNHFHQKPLSSKTTFIKNHFHQKPTSSKTNFIRDHFLSEGPTTRAKTM